MSATGSLCRECGDTVKRKRSAAIQQPFGVKIAAHVPTDVFSASRRQRRSLAWSEAPEKADDPGPEKPVRSVGTERMPPHHHPAAARVPAPSGQPACLVQAQRGVAYLRRGAWAAFLHTGERVGQFPSAREATAALGGAA